YIRGHGKPISDSLDGLQVAGRHLTGLGVTLKLEADLLAFDEFAHSGALDSRNVHERVRAAIVRLNEAEALGGVEPFNDASGHGVPCHSNTESTTRRRRGW